MRGRCDYGGGCALVITVRDFGAVNYADALRSARIESCSVLPTASSRNHKSVQALLRKCLTRATAHYTLSYPTKVIRQKVHS